MTQRSPDSPNVLLVGYNGADNTGAEAKLLVVLDELRSVLGPDARITVPSLNEANLRRYLEEGPTLQIKPVRPALFFVDIRKFVKENDLVLLVEGSCYMDTWSPALLWYYLLATRYAHGMKKPCIAYSVDAGKASRFDSWLIRREASKTDLILSRTTEARERLENWGVTAPIEVTADNAFAFNPEPADEGLLGRSWPEASHVVGIAAEDIYKWPAVIRLWGDRKYRYRWPYYYTHNQEHLEKSEALANALAVQGDEIVEKHDRSIALLSMEGLDTVFANRILHLMKHADRARIFSSQDYNASQITSILRSLELLITSRYHAGVLSLPSQVPQTAIGHDMRIRDLYADLGIPDLFVDHDDPDRFAALRKNVEALFSDSDEIRGKLSKGYDAYVEREKRNPILLREFLESHYPGWVN
ncbi:MAG TPA: polysaccharide pyruvyl transferase family protein [Candidatus Bathyarchaeia archaeon]|nr:polysaccharide pyruvyl transferase family protein [Candidatus Bathyarchaeia archaeon]